jgi:hypothetical protein
LNLILDNFVRNINFICSIGTGNYSETSYWFQQETWKTKFSPAALAKVLNLNSGKAVVLATQEAFDKWFHSLASELSEAGLSPIPVIVPVGRNEEELLIIFEQVVGSVDEDSSVYMDVTLSFRHLPFLYMAALNYLSVYKKVNIKGIYYGAYDLASTPKEDVPILELTPLFRLTQWYHALGTFQDSGDLRQIAGMLKGDVSLLFQGGRGDKTLSGVANLLDPLAEALAGGLPVEVGITAARLKNSLNLMSQDGNGAAAGTLALNHLAQWLEMWAVDGGSRSKTETVLTENELQRQLSVAAWYAELNDIPKALLLLREWMVNLFLFHKGNTRDWLEKGSRYAVEAQLHSLAHRTRVGLATEAEKRVGGSWQRLGTLRNKYAHAGMTPGQVSVSRDTVLNVWRDCEKLLSSGIPASTERKAGTLLVSCLGLSPGVIYSAVSLVHPDNLLIVTSREARYNIEESLRRAGTDQLPIRVLEMQDPFSGFAEADGFIDDSLRSLLAQQQQLVVNVAGGTSVMQYVIERIAEEAYALGVPVQRGAVVDRRPPASQRDDPYVLGEWVELDSIERVDNDGE